MQDRKKSTDSFDIKKVNEITIESKLDSSDIKDQRKVIIVLEKA